MLLDVLKEQITPDDSITNYSAAPFKTDRQTDTQTQTDRQTDRESELN